MGVFASSARSLMGAGDLADRTCDVEPVLLAGAELSQGVTADEGVSAPHIWLPLPQGQRGGYVVLLRPHTSPTVEVRTRFLFLTLHVFITNQTSSSRVQRL